MKKKLLRFMFMLGCLHTAVAEAKVWTLQECIDHALANNINLRQKNISTLQSSEDVKQSRAALFPSVSFSTNHNMSYHPFSESTVNLTDGAMTSNTNKVSYNGSYGINANWLVWNGNKNRMAVKQNRMRMMQSMLDEEIFANSIQEQIVQLYVQVLYEAEAVRVNEEIVKASQAKADRAKEMVEVGSLARVDWVQLDAQVAQDTYSLVNAQSQLERFRLELKQLLELHLDEDFEVIDPEIGEEKVMAVVPDKKEVYETALKNRPEIQASMLDITSAELSIKSARTGYMPTLSLTAGIGTNNSSGQNIGFATQIKNHLLSSLGLTLSVPIFDNLQTRTEIRKAKYAKMNSELNMEDQEDEIYSTVERYWLDATTAQQQYIYAKKNRESMAESYSLVSEQFNCGLKNIIELTTGKNNLLMAEQQLLQAKYTALLNRALLRFYAGEKMEL